MLVLNRVAIGVFAAVVGAGVYLMMGAADAPNVADTKPAAEAGPLVDVIIPARFTEQQAMGQIAFEANCAVCHGVNAVGRDGVGPPLVHKIYEPSHHGDEAFQRAVALGVRAHHWPFGNMAAVEGLTRADVEMIISYIRALQVENGID
ncbi:cytochrome c [Loktanella sp. PT4BL]|jgi:mono/diheme cytochrome c family protein|uniref:c-type cytochrome n=1 Tax=Loktanella sp. PT4BL TaxID=2135611 RepID=UPI000D7710F4|nr:cytochrome c [Loktanella sp. PT4BL]PXW72514.1 cytochrome c [Loktanella sp. PT4BL]